MSQSHRLERQNKDDLLSEARPRLVRLCAYLSGDADAAEDLAQESLLEAWRHAETLRDQAAWDAWVAGIARNVCRRWRRRARRELVTIEGDSTPSSVDGVIAAREDVPDMYDIEFELERAELAELLDRALALLPPPTRQVLVERYLLERPQAEVAARLRLSENVVAVRLHRGKRALRRALETYFPDEALSYGFMDAGAVGWQETRLWCPECGVRRLLGRLPSPASGDRFQMRCAGCHVEPGVYLANASRDDCHVHIAGARGFKRTLTRMMAWADMFYRPALAGVPTSCPLCGARLRVHMGMPQDGPVSLREQPGAHARCIRCGWETAQGLGGLLLGLPEGRRFWREQGHIRELPRYEIEADGESAWVTRFVSVETSARLDIVSAATTHRILGVHRRAGA